jgi:hypothetical protein
VPDSIAPSSPSSAATHSPLSQEFRFGFINRDRSSHASGVSTPVPPGGDSPGERSLSESSGTPVEAPQEGLGHNEGEGEAVTEGSSCDDAPMTDSPMVL